MARRRKRFQHQPATPESQDELLRRRAQRLRGEGDYRKAAIQLRRLAGESEEPRDWVALGAALAKARRREQALRAFKQGMFLHKSRGSQARARSVAKLILQLDPADSGAYRLASS